jgi:TPR repeat protein
MSGAQTSSQSPVPISTSANTQNTSISSAARKSQPSMPATYSPNNPPETTLARHKLLSQESSSRYQAAESAGRPAVADSKRSKKISATPQQLWASVQAGSSKAAVALADLYIRGEGVPVNCDQARVLLLVASEKNNAEAIQELRDLDKTDCPAAPH